MIDLFGLHFPGTSNFRFFQFFTYMFMHDTHSIEHVFFNMFAVYMFGRVLEQVWGPKRFLLFYLVTGLGAALTQELTWLWTVRSIASANHISIAQQIAFDPNVHQIVTVGASGAVFGILLAFGILFPNVPLYIMFVPIPIKAKYFVIGYGLLELFLGIAGFSGDNVAHFAHLGGMIFGFFMIMYWKKKSGNGQYFQ
jgi:membrane associated rhomboid family serine protease